MRLRENPDLLAVACFSMNKERVPEVVSRGKKEICIKCPRVTHGKKLCRPSLELLMGLNYAKLPMGNSWD